MAYHLQMIDAKTTCYCITDCLLPIKSWSDQNPGHHPLYIYLEFKDVWFENFEMGLRGLSSDIFNAFTKQLLEVWSTDRIITPSNIQGTNFSITL